MTHRPPCRITVCACPSSFPFSSSDADIHDRCALLVARADLKRKDSEPSIRIEKVRRQIGASARTTPVKNESGSGGGGGGGRADGGGGGGADGRSTGGGGGGAAAAFVGGAGSVAPPSAKARGGGLSEYELKRLKQIQENQAMLASLGLGGGNASRLLGM